MKKHLLFLLLAMSMPMFAQTTATVVTLGPGICNTSPANAYYCVDIAVTGIGHPGYTYAAFFVEPRSGPITTGWFTIEDDFTGTIYTPPVVNENNLVAPSSDSGWNLPNGGSIVLYTGPVGQSGTVSLQGTMGIGHVCGRWHNCQPIPKFMGGTAALTN